MQTNTEPGHTGSVRNGPKQAGVAPTGPALRYPGPPGLTWVGWSGETNMPLMTRLYIIMRDESNGGALVV